MARGLPISIIWPMPSIAMKTWPGVEILSAYLGSFGVGGVGVNRAFRSEAIRSLIEMSLNTADANHDRPKPRKPKS
jgi:hypothetical protein